MSGREYAAYDGQTCIGRIVLDDKTGHTKAFDAAGKVLGKFSTYDAARAAINEAYDDGVARRKARTAEALRRLEEPVGFVSGLPAGSGGEKLR
jgi:hypothetical protein